MGDDRYITIKVAYDHGPHDERPLSWIAPELTHAQLTMTEHHTKHAESVAYLGRDRRRTHVQTVRGRVAPKRCYARPDVRRHELGG